MKVKFLPQEIVVDIQPTETVLEVAQKNNIYIKTICNGVPSCAECRVRVVEGDHYVLPPSAKEKILIGTAHFIDQRRLSCQLHCFGDITVDLSEQVEKQKNEGLKKRLKSGVVVDETQSRARSGNLLDQDEDLLKEIDREVGDEVAGSDSEYEKSVLEQLKSETLEEDLKPVDKRRNNRTKNGRGRGGNQSSGGGRSRSGSSQDGNESANEGGSDKSSGGGKNRRPRNRKPGQKGNSQGGARSAGSGQGGSAGSGGPQRDGGGGQQSGNSTQAKTQGGGGSRNRNRNRNRKRSGGPKGQNNN